MENLQPGPEHFIEPSSAQTGDSRADSASAVLNTEQCSTLLCMIFAEQPLHTSGLQTKTGEYFCKRCVLQDRTNICKSKRGRYDLSEDSIQRLSVKLSKYEQDVIADKVNIENPGGIVVFAVVKAIRRRDSSRPAWYITA